MEESVQVENNEDSIEKSRSVEKNKIQNETITTELHVELLKQYAWLSSAIIGAVVILIQLKVLTFGSKVYIPLGCFCFSILKYKLQAVIIKKNIFHSLTTVALVAIIRQNSISKGNTCFHSCKLKSSFFSTSYSVFTCSISCNVGSIDDGSEFSESPIYSFRWLLLYPYNSKVQDEGTKSKLWLYYVQQNICNPYPTLTIHNKQPMRKRRKSTAWSHMESILGLELVLTQGPF